MQSRLRRTASRAGNALLWVTAVLGAVSLVLGAATVVAGVQPLIFRSSSMSPAIDAGALALAKTVDADQVKVDDVVSVVNASGVRVTHRVVEIDGAEGDQRSFTLKGDANRSPDESPYLATEVDRVFFDVPYLGYVANWLASPWAMFAAGILVALLAASLWRRRSESTGAPGVGTGAAAVAAVGLAAAALLPVPRTEAYFSDEATFEAGSIQAHQVRIFDWDTTPCTTNAADGTVTLRYKVTSPRYRMAWYAALKGAALPTTPFLTVTPTTTTIDAVVSTQLTRASITGSQNPISGTYQVAGRSMLKGSATTPWTSNAIRSTDVTIDATSVRCGDINLPPTLTFSSPKNGVYYVSPTAIDLVVAAQCGRPAPCGTATDQNGIYRVEYKLQRSNWWSTQCWAPEAAITGYYIGACNAFRTADTTPATPNTSSESVTWRIPVGSNGPGTTFNSGGDYTLYLRVYDNSPARTVTERTIRFTVG